MTRASTHLTHVQALHDGFLARRESHAALQVTPPSAMVWRDAEDTRRRLPERRRDAPPSPGERRLGRAGRPASHQLGCPWRRLPWPTPQRQLCHRHRDPPMTTSWITMIRFPASAAVKPEPRSFRAISEPASAPAVTPLTVTPGWQETCPLQRVACESLVGGMSWTTYYRLNHVHGQIQVDGGGHFRGRRQTFWRAMACAVAESVALNSHLLLDVRYCRTSLTDAIMVYLKHLPKAGNFGTVEICMAVTVVWKSIAPAASRLNRTTFRFLADVDGAPRRLPGVRLPARAAALAALAALPTLAAFLAADPGSRPVSSRIAIKSQKPGSRDSRAFSLPVGRSPAYQRVRMRSETRRSSYPHVTYFHRCQRCSRHVSRSQRRTLVSNNVRHGQPLTWISPGRAVLVCSLLLAAGCNLPHGTDRTSAQLLQVERVRGESALGRCYAGQAPPPLHPSGLVVALLESPLPARQLGLRGQPERRSSVSPR